MMRGKFIDGPSLSSSSGAVDTSEGSDPTVRELPETVVSTNSIQTRNPVFDDLEAAENMVVQLLDIAASTADYLSSLAANPPPPISHHRRTPSDADPLDSHTQQQQQQHHHAPGTHRHLDDKLKKNSKEYLDTIKQIHSLLLPHAHMVKAYDTEPYSTTTPLEENNDRPNNQSMYTSKMELRLAREKKILLSEFLILEQQDKMAASVKGPPNGVMSNIDIISADHNRPILGKRKNRDEHSFDNDL